MCGPEDPKGRRIHLPKQGWATDDEDPTLIHRLMAEGQSAEELKELGWRLGVAGCVRKVRRLLRRTPRTEADHKWNSTIQIVLGMLELHRAGGPHGN